MTRKLVTVRRIDSISPIDGADRIVVAQVDGWQCVTKKDEFKEGDYCLFHEIDSFVPASDERYDFIVSKNKRTYSGKEGARVKTIRLRKVYSQGLALPLSTFPEVVTSIDVDHNGDYDTVINDRVDFADLLGVIKYDTEIAARTQGGRNYMPPANRAGGFPWYLRKSDQERLNNIYRSMSVYCKDRTFAATLKIDGSSGTYAYVTDERYQYDTYGTDEIGGQFILCSRNWALKADDLENAWYLAQQNVDLESKLKAYHLRTGRNIAVQAEVVGPGIQNSREGFTEYTLLVYAIFDIDTQGYLPHTEFTELAKELDIPTVPVVDVFKPFERFSTMQEFVDYSDNLEPIFAKVPEGIVYHTVDGDEHHSFKVISPKYLVGNDE